MSKTAIIVVDLQNDYFPGGKWTLSGTDAAAENAARVIDAARKAGDLVVHIRHEGTPDAPFFVPGTPGADIHPSVANREGEPVVVKHDINAFKDTDLKSILDGHGITDVVILGAMSHMCVDAATRAAADFGYSTTVVHDACATLDLEFGGKTVPAADVHAAFMSALAFGYARLVSAKEYVSA